MSEATLLSEKLRRFGVLGAGVIPDPLASLRIAEDAEKKLASKESPDGGYLTAAGPAAARAPIEPVVTDPAIKAKNGKGLTRDEILRILDETVRVQGIVQQEVSVLARKLAKEMSEKKKKKEKTLSFVDGHKKILELGLPQEPLEEYGLTESNFQRLLLSYEEDAEVMQAAQRLLHPAGKGSQERAQSITMNKIIEIHQFMVTEMQKVLNEFKQLPQEQRRTYTGKGCETTAELLVSIAVEQQLSVRCEDVEQAVIMYEEQLQGHADFTKCTEQLASMMQHLIGCAQPRVEKDEFVKILRHMGDSTKKAKVFAKKLYEDYRGKSCNITEAYNRFETFSDDMAVEAEGLEFPELTSVDLQLCRDEYRDNAEVVQAWDESGVETNLLMQSMMVGGDQAKSSSASVEDKPKGRKLKTAEIVEMQELMVGELKRTTEAIAVAIKESKGKDRPWKAELGVQMVQALASAAVERRYGTSAEEMTLAGFNNASALQRSERFVRATEKQQELLMQIPKLCGHRGA